VDFVPLARVEEACRVAREIFEKERAQAERVTTGETLRAQFRAHLRKLAGAIEE
jgi:hypothetical protein